ncbi:Proline--tRNA ligase [Mycobacteroides abscessus subsp. abscessus]|nr:Proline--tRNA ligase [Mycobacteroides abscessus subsp. abscessus]
MAPVINAYAKSDAAPKELEKVQTENQRSIEEVSSFLNVSSEECIKSLLFKVDDKYVLVLVRGDHEVNDIKLKNLFSAASAEITGPNRR